MCKSARKPQVTPIRHISHPHPIRLASLLQRLIVPHLLKLLHGATTLNPLRSTATIASHLQLYLRCILFLSQIQIRDHRRTALGTQPRPHPTHPIVVPTHKLTPLFGHPLIQMDGNGPRRNDIVPRHLSSTTPSTRPRHMLNTRQHRSPHTTPPRIILRMFMPRFHSLQIRTFSLLAIPTPVRSLVRFLRMPAVCWTSIASLVSSSSSKTSQSVQKAGPTLLLIPRCLILSFRHFSLKTTSHEHWSVSTCLSLGGTRLLTTDLFQPTRSGFWGSSRSQRYIPCSCPDVH